MVPKAKYSASNLQLESKTIIAVRVPVVSRGHHSVPEPDARLRIMNWFLIS